MDNEFDWIKETEPVANVPQRGTAWVIYGINGPEDEKNSQDFLFNHGIFWCSHKGERWYLDDSPIKNYSSVFDSDIRSYSMTYSPRHDLDATIGIASRQTNKEEIYIYYWDGKQTIFEQKIPIER